MTMYATAIVSHARSSALQFRWQAHSTSQEFPNSRLDSSPVPLAGAAAATLSKSVCWRRLLFNSNGWPEVSIERPRFNHTDQAVAKDQKQVATLLYRTAARS